MPRKMNCDPQTIVDSIEAIDNNDDKVKYIETVIYSCGKTIGKKIPKKKRALSGWNCYLRKCHAEGIPFPECMKNSTRKEKEYIPKKDYWVELAKKGC